MTKSRRETVLALVSAREGDLSDHARQEAVRLDLGWADVVSVVGTAIRHHAERDEKKQARWKDSFVGRDTRGRRLYLAGKELLDEGERIWFVISVHEADPE